MTTLAPAPGSSTPGPRQPQPSDHLSHGHPHPPKGTHDSRRGTERSPGHAPGGFASRVGLGALSGLMFVLLILPVGGLSALLAGDNWWWSTASFVALVLGSAALVRLLPMPAFLSSLVATITALLAWAIGITVVFAPGTAWAGFVPTLETARALRSGLAAAGESIAVQSIPADPVQPIVLLLAVSVGLLALLADALVFAIRMPALAGFVSMAIFAVPYAVHQQDLDVWLFVSTSAAYLALLWVWGRLMQRPRGRRGRTGLRALASGALAIAIAVTLPAFTPGLTPESFQAPTRGQLASVYSSGVDPSIQLSQDLRRSNPLLALTYTTTSADGLYLQLVTLSALIDGPWEPETAGTAHPLEAGYQAPTGLAPDVATAAVTTNVSVSGLRSDWVPVPYPATGITGLTGDWILTPGSLTLTGQGVGSLGQNYTVSSLEVTPTAAQLAAATGPLPGAIAGYTALPGDIAAVIGNTARLVTASAATPYDKAVALQRYFTSGAFQYSVTAPVEGHYDGGNFAAVATFLSAKSGYCIHFASAMAVMARTLGIPSRIAIGYHPGPASGRNADGTSTFQVFSDQLHAWPELWFEGIGWLAFEPTPGLGIVPPDYSLPSYAITGAGAPARDSAGSALTTTTPKPVAEKDTASNPVIDAQTKAQTQGRAWLIALAVALVVVLAAVTPASVRRLRRRRRLSAMMRAPNPATLGWSEVCDTANDYRLEVPHSETARAFAARLGAIYRMPAEPVAALLVAVEREQFARQGAGETSANERVELVEHVRAIIRAISAQASTADDRRAVFLPLSLLAGLPLLSVE